MMKQEDEHSRISPKIPDPADVFVKASEILIEGYERKSKLDEREMPRNRRAVKRKEAGENLFLVLLGFSGSVGVTRIFLELAGYPQIGNEELHIAHVLWGGLFVFVSSLLLLVLVNPWVITLCAVLSGVGMGLFIDEVGKFLTQTNDYFFPAAAPIIYVVFLLTAWLYLRIRRPPTQDPRAVMYRVLEGLSEVLDRDLDSRERAWLKSQLTFVEENADHVDLGRLATALKDFLASDDLELAPLPLTLPRRWKQWRISFLDRWVPRNIHKILLGAGMITLSVFAIKNFVRLMIAAPNILELEGVIRDILDRGVVQIVSTVEFFSVWISLEAAMGVLLILATVLLFFVREKPGLALSQRTLVLYIGIVNIFAFYFNQFSIIPFALLQFFILWVLKHYWERDFVAPQ
jgi:hypothetical protein